MTISKIQDSISVIITLQAALDEYLKILKKESTNTKSIAYSAISSQIFLMVLSFRDEWDLLGKDEKIVKVRKIASPFIKKIDEWSDLRNVRNTFIAHNFRDSNGQNTLLKSYLTPINIPENYIDIRLMCFCVFCAKQILITEFSTEYNELIVYLKTVEKPIIIPGLKNEKDEKKVMDFLFEQSKVIKDKLDF